MGNPSSVLLKREEQGFQQIPRPMAVRAITTTGFGCPTNVPKRRVHI
jgi:hypothetical protein